MDLDDSFVSRNEMRTYQHSNSKDRCVNDSMSHKQS